MRIFCDWSEPFLPAVARHLLDATQGALGNWIVVTRGRASGRRLLFLLASEAVARGLSLSPPRMLTLGSLPSEYEVPLASPLLSRLAWNCALRQTPPETLEAVWKFPEHRHDTISLSSFLEPTSRELDAAGLTFRSAFMRLEKTLHEQGEEHVTRWQALAEIEDRYVALLTQWGFTTTTHGLRDTRWNAEKKLALVGLVECPSVFTDFFERKDAEVSVFIHAPESEAGGFDAWGRLNVGYWKKRPLAIPDEVILHAEDTAGQVASITQRIKEWHEAGIPAQAMTLALPDSNATADFEMGLSDCGISARAAGGRSLARGEIATLLETLAELCETPCAYASLARLLRHSQTQAWLGNHIAALDAYFNTHLPETLVISADSKLQTAIEKITVSCAKLHPQTLPADLRKLLEEIFADKPTLHRERDRALVAGLEETMAAIEEIESLPSDALKAFSVSELLREVATSVACASVPESENPQAIEIAGWLEAALDDAPALIVASVYDGVLPETVPNEPLLHDGLRERLGLPCRATRYARDQYTLWSVASPRKGLFALVAPRRDNEGAPVCPSRLLLTGLKGESLARRVLRLMNSDQLSVTSDQKSAASTALKILITDHCSPITEKMQSHRIFTVTSFADYLRSQRLFYFKHVLGLRETDDTAREMDASVFGTFTHEVLRRFGKNHLGREERSLDSATIKRELDGILDAVYVETFGNTPLAALPLQREVLRMRLATFAEKQAELFAEGWQIVDVEKKCEMPFANVVLKGKIDRIDYHAASERWRVLDYKTGSASDPTKQHFSKTKGWLDLQFPLYAKLLTSFTKENSTLPTLPDDTVHFCYFHIPAELDKIKVSEPFDNEKIEEGWEKAARIVHDVTSGEGCRDIGTFTRYDSPTFIALCGGNVANVSEEGDV